MTALRHAIICYLVGDWCDTHKLPKSQCIECDPGLKAKFEGMAPKS